MREIKFRGRKLVGEDAGKWAYGWLSTNIRGNPVINDDNAQFPVAVDVETVGQYTGMKDFNGKEIYEGDIIKINEEECYSGEHVGDVCFLDVGGCWYINGVRDGLADINRNYWIDVIGNIYENPELLGGADDEH